MTVLWATPRLPVFEAFFYLLQRNEDAAKALMRGCKFTWRNVFSQIQSYCGDALEYLVTAASQAAGCVRIYLEDIESHSGDLAPRSTSALALSPPSTTPPLQKLPLHIGRAR